MNRPSKEPVSALLIRSHAAGVGVATLWALARASAEAASLAPEAVDFFEAKIRPVLVAECYECHSAQKTKGGLRVDFRDGLRKGGDNGLAVVPGDLAKSLLLTAIKHLDPD